MTSTFERDSDIDLSHFVYRLYAVDGSLLYVGVTNNICARLRQHAKQQPWWNEVADATVQVTKGRPAAHDEEIRAIQHEMPRHNMHPGQGSSWYRQLNGMPPPHLDPVPLRLSEAEKRPVQQVADAECNHNLSDAIRKLLAEALTARTERPPR